MSELDKQSAMPLPSRERAEAALANQLEHPESIETAWTVLKLVAEGRLFDREAINYEAHERMVQRFIGYLNQGGTVGTSIDEIGVLSREMVAAAIGDTG